MNGRRARKEILEKIDYARSGTISHYLKDLVEAGFLDKHYAWSLQTGKKIRRSVYRLKDNFLRFSLKYIRPNLEKIAAGEFELEETFLQNKLYAIAGLQFENLVLNNRRLIYDALGIAASEVMNVGPYRQMPNSKQKGCQIDLLIQTRLNTLFVCEIKFSRDAITSEVIDEMKTKITHLKKPKQLTCVPVLIHINGVRDAVIDSDYFYRVINFTKFLVNESREV